LAGCSKRPISKPTVDENTEGVDFSTSHPTLPRQLALRMGYIEEAFEARTMHG
jgi:hypothetical protein